MPNDFSYTILEYINNAIRNVSVKPLNLGGISSSGGGSGIPPGGFIGYLPQTRVAYDLSESTDINASGSLLDNLNHIRYRLNAAEEVISLSGGHVILDEGVPVTPRTSLDFVGAGVTLSDDEESGTTIVTIAGGSDSGVLPVVTITEDVTLDDTYSVVNVDAIGGQVIITLPLASSYEGKTYTIKKVDAGYSYVRIYASGSDTIDGLTIILLKKPFENLTIQSDGISSWYMHTNPLGYFVPEGSALQIGATTGAYPTTSEIKFGDSSNGVRIYEKYDDNLSIALTGDDALILGYDETNDHFIAKIGDIDYNEHGHYLDISSNGFVLNADTTISGNIYANNLVEEAPFDNEQYARINGDWQVITVSGITASGSGGHIIQDEGISVPQRNILNFVGNGVAVTDLNAIVEDNTLPVFDSTESAHLDVSGTYLEWSHVLGSGINRVVIVGTAMRVATSTSVLFNGKAMTLIRRDKPGSDVCSELWYIIEEDLPTSGTYTVRVNASQSQTFAAGSVSFSNCSALVDYVGVGNNGADDTTASVALYISDYQVIVDVLALQSSNYIIAGDNATELWEEDAPANVGGMSWKKNSDGGSYEGTTWTFGSSDTWAMSAIALRGGATATEVTTVTISGGHTIYNEGVATPKTPILDFVGGGVDVTTEYVGTSVDYDIELYSKHVSDNYPIANVDSYAPLDATYWSHGQTFEALATDYITSCAFYIKRVGSPTGNMYAKLYAHTGTWGSTGKPTGDALAISDPIDVSTISTSADIVELTFSSPYMGVHETKYCIVLDYVNGNGSNYIDVGYDSSTPSHSGNYCYRGTSSSWSSFNLYDVTFYIFIEWLEYEASSDIDEGFVNTEDGADTNPFTAGETVSYTAQEALTNGTWLWRARAKIGAVTSEWTEKRSFLADSSNTLTLEEYRTFTPVADNTNITIDAVTADKYDFGTDTTPTIEFVGTDLIPSVTKVTIDALSYTGINDGDIFIGARANQEYTNNVALGITPTCTIYDGFPAASIITNGSYLAETLVEDGSTILIDLGSTKNIWQTLLASSAGYGAWLGKIYGSNDNSNWTQLDITSKSYSYSTVYITTITFPVDAYYRYFKYEKSNIYSGYNWPMSEIKLFEYTYDVEFGVLPIGEPEQYLGISANGTLEWEDFATGVRIPEDGILYIGDGSTYPTTAKIQVGDGDYIQIYEKTDDLLAFKIDYADIFRIGWTPGFEDFVAQLGDMENTMHGYYLNIDENGIALNGDVTVSGVITSDTLSGENTGDQVGDGVTILGLGTVGDPFVATISGVTSYSGGIVINESGDANTDFRVESDTEADIIFVDSSADTINLGGITNSVKIAKGGLISLEGTSGIQLPHMMQSDSTDQAISNVNNAQIITFNTDVHHLGITRTSSSRFTIIKQGSYLITFSGIASGVATKRIEFWLRIDGNDVASSNTAYVFKGTAQGAVVACSFIQHFNTGEYFEFWTWGDDTGCKWDATAAGTSPTRPAIPSIIITCNYISND